MAKSKSYRHPGGVLAIPRQMVRSQAYKDLMPTARALIIELQDVWRPPEPELHFSVRRASAKLGVSNATACKAFSELWGHGFIKCTEQSDWFNGKARVWRLNWLANNGFEPTNEYLDWKENKTGVSI